MPKRYEEKIPVPALEQMVSSVNKSDAVRPEELLSNKVYYYDGKKLTVASEKKKTISDTAEKIIKGNLPDRMGGDKMEQTEKMIQLFLFMKKEQKYHDIVFEDGIILEYVEG